MAKKEQDNAESGSRQIYEMDNDQILAMLNEQSKKFRVEILDKDFSDSAVEEYFSEKNYSDDDLFNLFFGLDFINKSDYAVNNKLADKLEDRESANYLYEGAYHQMQKRLGSELYGSEYVVNL
jgi:hypothetical protein